MLSSEEIIRTMEMLKNENLDVRTVTLGISLRDCACPSVRDVCLRVRQKIHKHARDLVSTCDRISRKYGIPIVNKRLAVTPIAAVAEGLEREEYPVVARALDEAAREVGVNFIGGYSALVQKGFTRGDRHLIDDHSRSPRHDREGLRLGQCGFDPGRDQHGCRLPHGKGDQGDLASRRRTGTGSAAPSWSSSPTCPKTTRSWPGPIWGTGSRSRVINVGVSGPGVVKRELERAVHSGRKLTLGRPFRNHQKDQFPGDAGGRADRPGGRPRSWASASASWTCRWPRLPRWGTAWARSCSAWGSNPSGSRDRPPPWPC